MAEQTTNVETRTDPTQTTSTTTSDTTSPETKTGQPTKFEYTEDRSKWIPPHRLTEETKKRQEYEQRLTAAEARAAENERRVRALAGVETPNEEEAEFELVKGRLTKLFPWMARMSDENVEKLMGLLDSSEAVQDSNVKIWRNHASGMLNSVYSEIEKGLGGGELSDRQRQKIWLAYRERAANDSEFLTRHEDGDKKLIADFAKEWLDDFVEPARRMVTSTQVDRGRRVPNGGRTTPVTSTAKKVDYSNDDAFGDALIAEVREKGGVFAR